MTGPALHPSTEELADLAEGIADRPGELRAHLADCAECAETLALLGELPALLAAEPVEPMPESVAARITAALEAEPHPATGEPATALAGSAAPTAAGTAAPPAPGTTPSTASPASNGRPPSTEPPTTPAPAPRRRRLYRALLTTAAGLAVATLTTVVVVDTGDSGSDGAAKSAGSARDSAERGPVPDAEPSRGDTSDPGATGLRSAGPDGGGADDGKAGGGAAGVPYTDANLPERVRDLAGGEGGVSPAAVPRCSLAAAESAGKPLAAGLGDYQDQPSAVLVYRHATASDAYEVYVVSTRCTDDPGRILLRRAVPE